MPSQTTFNSLQRVSVGVALGTKASLGERVIQSTLSGRGCVPLVSYEFSNLVQGFNQRVSEEERGLSSCDDNVVSRIFQYFRYDVGFFLLHSRFVCGVAEGAFEIAST